MFNMKNLISAGVFAWVAMTGAASAATFNFIHIAEAGDGAQQISDGAAGVAQLSLSVTSVAQGVSFAFSHNGPGVFAIHDVYWDDRIPLLSSILSFTGVGVSFSEGASPPVLPGGNNVGFSVSASGDATTPQQNTSAVNAGETLTVLFDLLGTATGQNVIDAMDGGDLRVGIHVQQYANGGSEAFYTGTSNNCVPSPANDFCNVGPPVSVIPLPASLPLLLGAFGVFGIASRRKSRKAA